MFRLKALYYTLSASLLEEQPNLLPCKTDKQG